MNPLIKHLCALLILVFAAASTSPAAAQLIFDKEKEKEKDKDREKEKEKDKEKESTCPNGMISSEFTQGNCCWSGQAWNGSACVGLPDSCPIGYEVHIDSQSCRFKCSGGRVATVTNDHCCWPGQAWNGGACVGLPTLCPEGLVPSAAQQACIQDCPEGQVVTNDQCCWDGQVYTDGACSGSPSSCPEGYINTGQDCALKQDSDNDGVIDSNDTCPELAEDMDGFQDDDGCPDPDNDGDGLCDATLSPEILASLGDVGCKGSDACPLDAEDFDRFEDDDGCPEEATFVEKIDPPSDEGGSNVAAWSSLAAGVVLMGAGTGLLVYGGSERDRVREAIDAAEGDPVSDMTQKEAGDIRDTANTLTVAGGIAMGLGAAAAITGVVLFFTGDEDSDTSISGSFDEDRVMIHIGGRF